MTIYREPNDTEDIVRAIMIAESSRKKIPLLLTIVEMKDRRLQHCLPGGHRKEGEERIRAIKRELREETNYDFPLSVLQTKGILCERHGGSTLLLKVLGSGYQKYRKPNRGVAMNSAFLPINELPHAGQIPFFLPHMEMVRFALSKAIRENLLNGRSELARRALVETERMITWANRSRRKH